MPSQKLKEALNSGLVITPCCGDALTAKLIEQAGFEATFVSGFGIAASRLALPDTGLISFGEILDQVRNIRSAVGLALVVDGDTGYGNEMNVRRTVAEYARLGAACVMIEDQVAPKRCGQTQGKQVVDFDSACRRIQAAVDARDACGSDILLIGRTDALAIHGVDEAIRRANAFYDIGCEITFVESPRNLEELQQVVAETKGFRMANMLEGGLTPFLQPAEVEQMGFSLVSYPFTLLMGWIAGAQRALREMKNGSIPNPAMSFEELRSVLGFDEYGDLQKQYGAE